MFSLADFPIGNYFYWIRTLHREDICVYTKLRVDDHDANENLINYIKNGRGETLACVYERSKYLYPSNSFYIPESLYLQIHSPEKQILSDDKTSLQKILLTGHSYQDELVRRATLSFVEYDQIKRSLQQGTMDLNKLNKGTSHD